jgi:hypothetical protein
MTDINIMKNKIEELTNKILELEKENFELKEHLKKYTNNESCKRYYEKNKDKVKENGANYLQKLKTENPEKLKEYRKNAYLKRKEKLQQNINTLEK